MRALFLQLLTVQALFGATKAAGCGGRADIVFLLDRSGSITQSDFDHSLQFVKDVTSNFVIGPDDVQIGVDTFSSNFKDEFTLNEFSTQQDIDDAVDGISYAAGETHTDLGLRSMANDSFTAAAGHRTDVPKIAIVVTDGKSEDFTRTSEAAQTAREAGIHIFSVGVGEHVNETELKAIASDPDSDNVFTVDTFDSLKSLQGLLAAKVCQHQNVCAKLPPVMHGSVSPASCITSASHEGKECVISCSQGFVLSGPSVVNCTDSGQWNDTEPTNCTDVQPPSLTCPADVLVVTQNGQRTAQVTWPSPVVQDNAGAAQVKVTSSLTPGTNLGEGHYTVMVEAVDSAGLSTACAFYVTVTVGVTSSPVDFTSTSFQAATTAAPGGATATSYPADATSAPLGSTSAPVDATFTSFPPGSTSSPVGPAPEDCPSDWVHVAGGCYVYRSEPMTWFEAQDRCGRLDGHLVEIMSMIDNYVVTGMAASHGASMIWIGLHDIAVEGYHVWSSTHEALSFTHWASNEPNSTVYNEDCGAMLVDKGGVWGDEPCDEIRLPFVCEAGDPVVIIG